MRGVVVCSTSCGFRQKLTPCSTDAANQGSRQHSRLLSTCRAGEHNSDPTPANSANKTTITRRQTLQLGAAGAATILGGTGAAEARYSLDLLQPCTSLEQCRAALEKFTALAADPEDKEAEAFRYFFQTEVEALQANRAFLKDLRQGLQSGSERFLQHAVISVQDLDKEVEFWTMGMGAKVTRTRVDSDGLRTAFVAFGPETMLMDDGGKFALELVESKGSKPSWVAPAPQLAYVQLALANVRLGAIVDSGAEIVYSFGYLEIISPNGVLVKSRTGVRRDPMEVLAYRVPDVEAAAQYYEEGLGMRRLYTVPPPVCAQVSAGGWLGKAGLAKKEECKEDGDVFSPYRPPGSVYLGYGDRAATVSVLLLQSDDAVESASRYQKLAVAVADAEGAARSATGVGGQEEFIGAVPGIGTKVGALRDPAGYGLVFVDYEDFEKEQPSK